MMQNVIINANRNYRQEQYPCGNFDDSYSPVYLRRMGSLWSTHGFRWEKLNREVNLHFVTAGMGHLQIGERKYDIVAGDVFILFPLQQTCYWDLPGQRWRYDWITLSMPPPYPVLQQAGFSPDQPVRALPLDAPIWDGVKKLRLTLRQSRGSSLFPAIAAWEVLDLLLQSVEPEPRELAEQLRAHIDQADPPPEVKELARRFGVSRSTIYRAFRRAYGQPVKNYLNDLRFANACELLQDTAFGLDQIAASCGFSCSQYFCRAFKARYQLTPTQWRLQRCNKF